VEGVDDYSDLMAVAETANEMSQNLDFDLRLISDSGATKEQVAAVTALIQFAAKPGNVLDLLAEIKRLRTVEGDAMTYKAGMENVAQQRDQFKAEAKENQMHFRAFGEVMKSQAAQIEQLKAERDELKTVCGAFDRVNTKLKAENEALRKFEPSKEVVWCACGDGYPANSYGAGFMDANNGVCQNCDASMSKAEQ
jgi:hypothetical protein